MGAAASAAVLAPGAVHVPERRSGEGGEHERVVRDGVGDGLAAEQPGADHLERVAGVDAGAGGADGLAPVAACPVQGAERGIGGAELRQHLTRRRVDRRRGALQPDRMGAVAGAGSRLGERAGRAVAQTSHDSSSLRVGETGQVEGDLGGVPPEALSRRRGHVHQATSVSRSTVDLRGDRLRGVRGRGADSTRSPGASAGRSSPAVESASASVGSGGAGGAG